MIDRANMFHEIEFLDRQVLNITEKEAWDLLTYGVHGIESITSADDYLKHLRTISEPAYQYVSSTPEVGLIDPRTGVTFNDLTETQINRLVHERLFDLYLELDRVVGGEIRHRSFYEFFPAYAEVAKTVVPPYGDIMLAGSLGRYTSQGFLQFCDIYFGDHQPVIVDPFAVLSYVEGVSVDGTLQKSGLEDESLSAGFTNFLLQVIKDEDIKVEIPRMLEEIYRILIHGGVFTFMESPDDIFQIRRYLPEGFRVANILREPRRIRTRSETDQFFEKGEIDDVDLIEDKHSMMLVLRKA